jgi:hypothetical protein
MHFGKQESTKRKCEGVDTQLILKPYRPNTCPTVDGKQMTPHHLIPHRCTKGMPGYSKNAAPCICVQGRNQHTGSHRGCHRIFDPVERWHAEQNPPKPFTYSNAKKAAAESAKGGVTPPRDKLTKKELDCIKAQLDEYYTKEQPDGPGLKAGDPMKTSKAPGKVNELYPQVEAAGGGIPGLG